MRASWGAVLTVAAITSCGVSDEASAQTPSEAGGDPAPAWMRAWSPLSPVADLPRVVPGNELRVPGLGLRPPPRSGLFWSAGNPAALAAEIADAWSAYGYETRGEDGAYRRPLDPGEESGWRLAAEGWRGAGVRGAAIGRFVVDRAEQSGPALANSVAPFGSNPFVPFDTSGTALGRTTIRIEGAGGMQLGALGLGAALGFEALETRTEGSPVPRLMRSAAPTAGLGATLAVPRTGATLGIHGRWQSVASRTNLYAVAATTRLYHLRGYTEPPPQDLSTYYLRESDREARALGAGITGRALGLRMTLFGEIERAREAQTSLAAANPPQDVWDAAGTTFGAAAEGRLPGGLLLHGTVRRAALEGELRLVQDPDYVAFTAAEKRLELTGELRLPLENWEFALLLSGVHEGRVRTDSLAGFGTEIVSWTTGGGIEALRRLPVGFTLTAALGAAVYRAAGALPMINDPGFVYAGVMGPELSFYGSDALSRTGTLTLGWQPPRGGGTVFLRGRWGDTSPLGETPLPWAPDAADARSRWGLQLGVVLP
jgi:hypothetical protein